MEKERKFSLKKIDKHVLWLFIIIAGVFIFASLVAPKAFLRESNFKSMAFQFPEFGIMAFGMMICMVAGGIDLSVVGIANLSGIFAALVMTGMGTPTTVTIIGAVIAALVVGALSGFLNGLLIGYLRIPAMLVTLSGLQIYTGLGLAITKGPAITGIPESFQQIGNGLVFGAIPISLLVFAVITFIMWYILRYTIYGQQLFMMGANPITSEYSGINNFRVTLKTYTLSGILAAISGIIICSHYGSAKSDYGSSYTLLTLLIVILGGVSPAGGKGKISGVVLAVLILQIISSAFSILRFNSFIKTFVFGLVLIIVMIIEYLSLSGIIKQKEARKG